MAVVPPDREADGARLDSPARSHDGRHFLRATATPGRDQAIQNRHFDFFLELQPRPQADLLDFHVALKKLQFFAQRDFLPARLVQRQAQQFTE